MNPDLRSSSSSVGAPSRLGRLFKLDAATCVAAGLVMAAGAAPLATWTGLPAALLTAAGLALLPVAALFAFIAMRPGARRGLAWFGVVGNVGWVIGSLAVLAVWPATAFGIAFVLAQAAVVALLAVLEARALVADATPGPTGRRDAAVA